MRFATRTFIRLPVLRVYLQIHPGAVVSEPVFSRLVVGYDFVELVRDDGRRRFYSQP